MDRLDREGAQYLLILVKTDFMRHEMIPKMLINLGKRNGCLMPRTKKKMKRFNKIKKSR